MDIASEKLNEFNRKYNELIENVKDINKCFIELTNHHNEINESFYIFKKDLFTIHNEMDSIKRLKDQLEKEFQIVDG